MLLESVSLRQVRLSRTTQLRTARMSETLTAADVTTTQVTIPTSTPIACFGKSIYFHASNVRSSRQTGPKSIFPHTNYPSFIPQSLQKSGHLAVVVCDASPMGHHHTSQCSTLTPSDCNVLTRRLTCNGVMPRSPDAPIPSCDLRQA